MSDGIRWYEFLGLAAVMPASLVATVALTYWLLGCDPLVEEIWRLRGENSVLRERLKRIGGDE